MEHPERVNSASALTRIEPGAVVEATDGRLGTVDEVRLLPQTGALSHLVVRGGWTDALLLVPSGSIESVPHPREVRLSVTREEARSHTADIPQHTLIAREGGSELRVPIVEERLVPGTRAID